MKRAVQQQRGPLIIYPEKSSLFKVIAVELIVVEPSRMLPIHQLKAGIPPLLVGHPNAASKIQREI